LKGEQGGRWNGAINAPIDGELSGLPSEDRDVDLFFVTSRTRHSVFWLHPLLCSSLEPANREARRVIDAKRSRLDARLTRMLAAANKQRPPEQPQLTLAEAKTSPGI
jgi:hypothetical protein